jgi:hypothetical protein
MEQLGVKLEISQNQKSPNQNISASQIFEASTTEDSLSYFG